MAFLHQLCVLRENRKLRTNPQLMLAEILAMIRKELLIEWKQKYAFNGLMLYVASMVIVIALSFGQILGPIAWNVLYWIMILFASINAVGKSFLAEEAGQQKYVYSLAHPSAIILGKMIYNLLLLLLVAILTMGLFVLIGNIEIGSPGKLMALAAAGSAALAANLTLVAAVASKAENRSTLLAVLSFPIIIPVLMLLIRLSAEAIAPTGKGLDLDSLFFLIGITVVLAVLSVILFPFVWRD